MKLPNASRAFIDIRKLTDYCLNPTHPRGRNKARVFKAALGLTDEDAEELRDALLAAAQTEDADAGQEDEYGQRYTVDALISGPDGEATVRSSWIVRADEDFPRLTSCYVLED